MECDINTITCIGFFPLVGVNDRRVHTSGPQRISGAIQGKRVDDLANGGIIVSGIMRKPPVVVCEVIVNNEKKTVFALRINSGRFTRKRFEDYEDFYTKVKEQLELSLKSAPKKKFLQAEAKLNEKRRKWIIALVQELLANHHDNEDVREFLSLRDVEDYDEAHVDLGPKEHAMACASNFDFLNTIGKGNFGRVFQVRHMETGKIYAMKVLSKEHIRKKNEVKHVMAELSVLKSNIHHPFLVSLHFSFQSKDKLYFVLDHLNGGELFSHLQREKHFSESRSRFYAAEIASALGYLHDNNIIYRQLPYPTVHNVFITPQPIKMLRGNNEITKHCFE
ncbi:hypothetical protein Y032_0161g3390 [Ancylostoma ceylanicum]|uniref:Protein kinase domain-containing protein n=2 Tax=Ancylostoma ceylanicum TaxID=53326 RepID=A0A016SX80_9BILA|nr:hypothetical protein Y032_0161g3390 [Ancylostoma ceylanicum]